MEIRDVDQPSYQILLNRGNFSPLVCKVHLTFCAFQVEKVGEVETKDTHGKKYTRPNSLCRGVVCAFIFIEIYILTHNISSGVTF